MKKIIGVMPLWDDDKESLWMLPGYLDGLTEAGALPLIFPLDYAQEADIFQLCRLCDGFLLTGGHDVHPEMYGEAPLPGVYPCRRRDALEKQVLSYALSGDKAVFGICRGIQFLNAALGGTLYQDLPLQHPSPVNHHMAPPYDRVCHQVHITGNTPLSALLHSETIGVNSCHHQAVRSPAKDLEVMATAEDGLIEAVRMKDRSFVWAVQWHPEFSFRTDEVSQKLFAAFVAHC